MTPGGVGRGEESPWSDHGSYLPICGASHKVNLEIVRRKKQEQHVTPGRTEVEHVIDRTTRADKK